MMNPIVIWFFNINLFQRNYLLVRSKIHTFFEVPIIISVLEFTANIIFFESYAPVKKIDFHCWGFATLIMKSFFCSLKSIAATTLSFLYISGPKVRDNFFGAFIFFKYFEAMELFRKLFLSYLLHMPLDCWSLQGCLHNYHQKKIHIVKLFCFQNHMCYRFLCYRMVCYRVLWYWMLWYL